uniref:Uncharacterized protein n=1 Tax=Anguilla anguilla TaxID=7936 RepID=A0A0E9WAY6_ANGAN
MTARGRVAGHSGDSSLQFTTCIIGICLQYPFYGLRRSTNMLPPKTHHTLRFVCLFVSLMCLRVPTPLVTPFSSFIYFLV